MASEGGGAAAGGGQAVAPVRHSALVVTVIEAKDLSNTQVVTAQDPFCRVTWVKNQLTAQTDYVWGGGTSPCWEKRGSCSNVLRLDVRKKRDASFNIGEASLEVQNAESFPNALLIEILNSNWVFDDKISFAILNFSEDRETCWVERPTGGLPTKKNPAKLKDGRVALDLSLPVGQGDLGATGAKIIVTAHFE